MQLAMGMSFSHPTEKGSDRRTGEDDETGLLGPINDRMNLLRAGKRIGTSLVIEERKWMWNLVF